MKTLSGPRIPPTRGQVQQLVVLVHGYGADGNDLIGLAPHWQRLLPHAAFIAPNAPERCAMNPMGYQWFPIGALRPEVLAAGVDAAAPLLEAFIAAELAHYGLDGSRLALVGFSQGAMMSLHVGLRRAAPPAAIVGYSGALATPVPEAAARPPVLLVHGDADDMIPVPALHAAVQALGAGGVSVTWHVAQGLGHGIDPDGLERGGRFLADAFDGAFSAAGRA